MKNQLTEIDSLFIRFAKNGQKKTIRNLQRLYMLGWRIEEKYANVGRISDYLYELVTIKLNIVNLQRYYNTQKEVYSWGEVQKYFSDYGNVVMYNSLEMYNFYIANIITCLTILSVASIDDLPGFHKSCYWRNKDKISKA